MINNPKATTLMVAEGLDSTVLTLDGSVTQTLCLNKLHPVTHSLLSLQFSTA